MNTEELSTNNTYSAFGIKLPNDASGSENDTELGSGSLSALASANFSSDSLPATPSLGESALGNPQSQWKPNIPEMPTSGSRRTRPKSAIFMMDENSFPISEDGSPIQDAIDNTPRARRSFHFGGKYTPVIPMEPPKAPQGNSGFMYQLGDNLSQNSVTSSNPGFNFGPSITIGSPSSPTREGSPIRSTSPVRPHSPNRRRSSAKGSSSPVRNGKSPFNFKPLSHAPQPSISLKPSHRKGHKYKHSSVSMNIFQEPPASARPLLIPDAFPIPTFNELVGSITPEQKVKVGYSTCHLLLAGTIFAVGMKLEMPTLSTLAHLVFYDALRSFMTVFVNIMSNFDVWGSSSLQYPFGLGRIEVLVSFALATSLVMVGLDLISHSVEEFIIEMAVGTEEVSDHSSHHIHGGKDATKSISSWLLYYLLLVGVDIVSVLKVIGEEEPFKRLLSADSLTPLYATTLILLPLLRELHLDVDLDEATTLVVALLICKNGWALANELGGELLLSFPSSNYQYYILKNRITEAIRDLDCFKQSYQLDKLFITKFNRRLFVVGIHVLMHGGSSDEESMLRFEVNRVVRSVLFEYKAQKLEITIDVDRY